MWRMQFMIGSMAHTMTCGKGLARVSDGLCDPSDADEVLRQLIAFTGAGLAAPPHGGGPIAEDAP